MQLGSKAVEPVPSPKSRYYFKKVGFVFGGNDAVSDEEV